MIINFHPKEIESKKGPEIITKPNKDNSHTVVHASEKSGDEWRKIISSNEPLVLVAPVYWWGASYEFDKWVQDVFSYGFAFKYNEQGLPEGLLNGRAFEMHMTQGTPLSYAAVMNENIKTRLEKGIFGFTNSKVTLNFYDMHSNN
jgi:putative NADPH-quinone reductase